MAGWRRSWRRSPRRLQEGGAGHRADESVAGSGVGRAAVILGLGSLEHAARRAAGSDPVRLRPAPKFDDSRSDPGRDGVADRAQPDHERREGRQARARAAAEAAKRRPPPPSRRPTTRRREPAARTPPPSPKPAPPRPRSRAARRRHRNLNRRRRRSWRKTRPSRPSARKSRRRSPAKPEKPKPDQIAKVVEREKSRAPAETGAAAYDPNAIAKMLGQIHQRVEQPGERAGYNAQGLPRPTPRACRPRSRRRSTPGLPRAYLGCWTPPPTTPDGRRLHRRIYVVFNSGRLFVDRPVLLNPPPHPAWRAHAESALRAVHEMQSAAGAAAIAPYFEEWKTKTIHFDPRETQG